MGVLETGGELLLVFCWISFYFCAFVFLFFSFLSSFCFSWVFFGLKKSCFSSSFFFFASFFLGFSLYFCHDPSTRCFFYKLPFARDRLTEPTKRNHQSETLISRSFVCLFFREFWFCLLEVDWTYQCFRANLPLYETSFHPLIHFSHFA